ncbi:hypothetical protein RB195_016662 [Necator americanus]|uniref:Uncharacterized protein n=1 Tax=Necator americanus TaxID=51031 RepID=A0ABR1C443_NECAM
MKLMIALIMIGLTLLQHSNGAVTYAPPPDTEKPYPTAPPCATPAPSTPIYCPLCSCNPPKDCIPRKTNIMCLIKCPPPPADTQ